MVECQVIRSHDKAGKEVIFVTSPSGKTLTLNVDKGKGYERFDWPAKELIARLRDGTLEVQQRIPLSVEDMERFKRMVSKR